MTDPDMVTMHKLASRSLSLLVRSSFNGMATLDSPLPNAQRLLSHGFLHKSSMGYTIAGMRMDEDLGAVPKIRFSLKTSQRPASADFLSIQLDSDTYPLFDRNLYYQSLTSDRLGQVVLFVPTCTSTMDIANSLSVALPREDSIVVVAGTQTRGIGRAGNEWVSPTGCAMFSFNYYVDIHSTLGKSIGFLQHLLALSVVDGICSSLTNIKNFALKLKWPNDIYCGRSFKIGGILVKSVSVNSKIVCTLGCGINVLNSNPTTCLNEMLPQDVDIFSVERIIAISVSTFESLTKLFEQNGIDAILPIYYKYWMHTDEEVTIENNNETVVIRGLDSQGFLEVCSKSTDKVFSLHPDGNSFDIFKNHIKVKFEM